MNASEVRFDGQVAIVTGAGRGIGREFARLFASRGASVVVNDIGVSSDVSRYVALGNDYAELRQDAMSESVADEVVAELTANGGSALANRADVSDPDAAATIVSEAIDAFGRVDIVVNNAGVVPQGAFEDVTFDDMMRAISVHAGGVFNVTRAAWPHFRKQEYGRVVNICSSEGLLAGSNGFSLYGAAKGAVVGLTRSLSAEGAPLGISINGLLPAAMTRGNASVNPGYKRVEEIDKSPRFVAPAVCWLAHSTCDVTGQFFDASAGSMRSVYISAAEGYQHDNLDEFSIESLRDNWDEVLAREPAVVPSGWAELNELRAALYRRRVLAS